MLCAVIKLFELLIHKHLLLGTICQLTPLLHGFIPGRSTVTNLVQFLHYCFEKRGKGMQVDTIYTDFNSAFDCVNIQTLIAKLSKLGFHSGLIRWLDSYFVHRPVRVKIGDNFSEEFSRPSGVPQGSILEQLLFNLFINKCETNTKLFNLFIND